MKNTTREYRSEDCTFLIHPISVADSLYGSSPVDNLFRARVEVMPFEESTREFDVAVRWANRERSCTTVQTYPAMPTPWRKCVERWLKQRTAMAYVFCADVDSLRAITQERPCKER